jgi:YgiT-type zinc finger domain-containing protein
MNVNKQERETCPQCQVGLLHPRKVIYFGTHQGEPVSVPNVPAWVCDMCRYREYDDVALSDLNLAFGREQAIRSKPPRAKDSAGGTRPLPPTESGKRD